MTSWSAWNVTGSLNSEILRVLMDMQQNITLLQNNSVLKDGNNTTSALRIGTNNNYDVVIESNNTDRMTVESTGNVRVHNQIEISGSQSAPGLCASGDNSTGLWFPTIANAVVVGNNTNLLQVSTSDVIASGGKVSLGLAGPSLTATGGELVIHGANKDIHLLPHGSTGLLLDVNGQDLNIRTATGGHGATQVQINGKGTLSRPQYSFADNSNSGMYLDSSNNVSFAANGNDVMKLYSNGVDMVNHKIYFNSAGDGSKDNLQIVFDNTGARDTGIYSPSDGIIKFMNNDQQTLNVRSNVLGHRGVHNASGTQTIGSDLPIFESRLVTTMCDTFTWRPTGGSTVVYTDLVFFDIIYTRVGNVVTGTAMNTIFVPSTITANIIYFRFPLFYQKVNFSGQQLSPPIHTRHNWRATATLCDDDNGNDAVSISNMGPTTYAGQKCFEATLQNAKGYTNDTVTILLDFTYMITEPT